MFHLRDSEPSKSFCDSEGPRWVLVALLLLQVSHKGASSILLEAKTLGFQAATGSAEWTLTGHPFAGVGAGLERTH